MVRCSSGLPFGPSRGLPSGSQTVAWPPSHCECRLPLANFQCPVTR